MGCDIHIVIQAQEADGSWKEIPYQGPFWRDEAKEKAKPDLPIAPDMFDGRCYDLFAVLADVRNGSGFAGLKTGEGWPSIAPDRGFPEGFDPDAVAPDPDWEHSEPYPRSLGDHSFTWVTLDELKAFPWDTVSTRLYGVIPAEAFEVLGLDRAPKSYCGGISGPGVVTYEPDEYEAAKEARELSAKPHVRTHWTETAREATNDWPGNVLPWLESLGAGRPVRLVFGFDS